LKKKTLIVVHKEFLMNQWIERIQEFLPTAKVGKIQATVCDIDDKDIVIGMVQTLYSREYPQEVYSQFGLTIVDEVHRISSEQFSKTLFRAITPYMLGISATVKRKDGLERVLYSFIGKMAYSEERAQDDIVTVRAIEYITKDPEFNEVEQDFRGNTKYSTMISKLCAFCPRSDFIVRVLADLVAENPKAQIMILAHNRCLLTYLHDEIVSKNIATVGYYVGGMKETALKETESKNIVVATYSMAAEALDIKTLSTLVMVTPKTDIVQSVGRILRMKHDNPIIVDIVDSHEVFKNQWKQRKTFYRKSNYRIYTIASTDYTDMVDSFQQKPSKWKKAFEPKTGKKEDEDPPDEPSAPMIGKCMINIGNLHG
jgi:superfamily II DNA or RNA helicase